MKNQKPDRRRTGFLRVGRLLEGLVNRFPVAFMAVSESDRRQANFGSGILEGAPDEDVGHEHDELQPAFDVKLHQSLDERFACFFLEAAAGSGGVDGPELSCAEHRFGLRMHLLHGGLVDEASQITLDQFDLQVGGGCCLPPGTGRNLIRFALPDYSAKEIAVL